MGREDHDGAGKGVFGRVGFRVFHERDLLGMGTRGLGPYLLG